MKKQWFLSSLLLLSLLMALVVAPNPQPTLAEEPQLTADQAIVAAVNDLQVTADGYLLRHPRHTATFTPDGLEFRLWTDGPTWTWQLTAVSAGDSALAGIELGDVRPVSQDPLTVAFPRGGVVERYLAQKDTIEQQFLIPQPLPLDGADLVITGEVYSEGGFEETEDGWRWHTADGGVRLGRVTVYDAQGAILPAKMIVTADSTRIAVDGAALAQAAYPVIVDPEIGPDRRLSDMGPYADPDYDALNPAVAYDHVNNQYLVVWSGDHSADGEFEIWGQRVDGSNWNLYGANFRISFMGPANNPDYDAQDPDVVFTGGTITLKFFVVWSGDHYVDDEFEIFGQVVDSTGNLLDDMVRVSRMGPPDDPDYDAYEPAVVYNPVWGECLVVWSGDDTAGTLVNDEFEIWARRLYPEGGGVDPDKRRMSDMGGSGNASYDARNPDVAYNSSNVEYLLVWEGDDTGTGMANNEFEIFGQRLEDDLSGVGPNDFRISAMGPDNDANYDAGDPAIAYNSQDNQYLVVWEGTDVGPGVWQIYGRRLGSDGSLLGTDRFLLSHSGVGPNNLYLAYNPAVAYDQGNNEYLVVWQDDEMGVGEWEIWGQRVDGATGASIGTDTRLSDMGPEGNANHDAGTPAVAYSNESNNQCLVVWSGDNGTDGDFEIWGQRFTNGYKTFLPMILREYQ